MYRLFLPSDQIDGRTARITGADHQHLAKVLRAQVGQPVVVLDGIGRAYRATLTSIGKLESLAAIEESVTPPTEPPVFITVGQALGKGDKFEQVVQHGTEVGASRFIPVRAERSVTEIPDSRASTRAARWRAIAKGAAEQSFRARIPEVALPTQFAAVVQAAIDADMLCLVLDVAPSAVPLHAFLGCRPAPPRSAMILVGPEGGWSAKELDLAAATGCELISLGPRILRTETAALVAISQLLYHYSRSDSGPDYLAPE